MKTIQGDLLNIPRGLLLHQVNCRGVTGGLAGALRRKYPQAFEPYLRACRIRPNPAGTTVVADTGTSGLLIAHVFGQIVPGPNTDLVLVEGALTDLVRRHGNAQSVFAPYLMGCGLGGGNWADYSALLEKHFSQITIVRINP